MRGAGADFRGAPVLKLTLLDRLLDIRRNGDSAALVTGLAAGLQSLVTADDNFGDLSLNAQELSQIREAMEEGESRTIDVPAGQIFIEVWAPALRLIVVGAVHTAQSLAPMARIAGYHVLVNDPRTAFASTARFPGSELIHEWPNIAIPSVRPDRRTAVVTLTHNPIIDDAALRCALRTPAFYIGALGSRRTHARRRERMLAAGFSESEILRIHAPVGLPIGALTPGEIAVAVLAEMTASLRKAPLAHRTE